MPIAVLISGGGTTLQNLLQRQQAGGLQASIELVISSSATAKGNDHAERAGIPVHVKPWQRDYAKPSAEVFDLCRQAGVGLVVCGGFIKRLQIPADFENRVMNIHPSLIPAFCGAGYYGGRVHRAAIEYGVKVSGCTVHFVDNEYDHGPIILQRNTPVEPDDTPESLARRIFEEECQALPAAINLYASGRIRIEGRQISIQ